MAEEAKRPKTWQRPNVMALCLAAFFNDLGADMLFAFYPLFVVLILRLNEMRFLGLIESIAALGLVRAETFHLGRLFSAGDFAGSPGACAEMVSSDSGQGGVRGGPEHEEPPARGVAFRIRAR